MKFSIMEVAELTGVTPSCLRIWEQRYNWPRPKRKANGYRFYSELDVEQLKKMKACIDKGLVVSQLIVDGLPTFPDEAPAVVRFQIKHSDFNNLEKPTDKHLLSFHNEIIESLVNRDFSKVVKSLQMCKIQVRPRDRDVVCYNPIRLAIGLYKEQNVDVIEIENALNAG